jgi:hypothetical protein
MTNATRYLCAAAYQRSWFANSVIGELLSSHRAVAPSVGVDLGPIIRHSLRARNLQLTRDIVLAFLLLAGLYLAPLQTVFILFLAFFVGFLPSVDWARKSLGAKIVAVVAALGVAFLFVNFLAILAIASVVGVLERLAQHQLGTAGQGLPTTTTTGAPSLISTLGVVLLIAMLATQVTYIYVRNRTLSDELGPEARPRPPRPRGAQTETRIAQVEAAQHGNLFLYRGENPFIGTGKNPFIAGKDWGRAWSIAIELERSDSGGEMPWGPSRHQGYAPIDPVELHQVIRDRLVKLKDDKLPPNERLSALTVEDHIVGMGAHRWDSPLIDPVQNVPYSQASPEAVAALIRHPQAGLRYYQRFSVCDEGQAVWSGREQVIGGWDQHIAASAFVYVAVEGRMFYLEFVAAVMPPVQPAWRAVDRLPKISAGSFAARVVLDALRLIFQDLIYAPFRAIRALRLMWQQRRSYQDEAEEAKEYVYGDVGARISVRETGASGELGTYIQRLDAEKYTKLAERLITDTVLDYLAASGVDTSAYAASATTVINSGVMIGGAASVTGPVAAGLGSRAQVTNQARPAAGEAAARDRQRREEAAKGEAGARDQQRSD